jgi:hypothetical protein
MHSLCELKKFRKIHKFNLFVILHHQNSNQNIVNISNAFQNYSSKYRNIFANFELLLVKKHTI